MPRRRLLLYMKDLFLSVQMKRVTNETEIFGTHAAARREGGRLLGGIQISTAAAFPFPLIISAIIITVDVGSFLHSCSPLPRQPYNFPMGYLSLLFPLISPQKLLNHRERSTVEIGR